MEDGVARLESRVAKVEDGVARLESRVARIESDVSHMQKSLANVETDLRDLRKSMDQRFETMDARFERKLDALEKKESRRFYALFSAVVILGAAILGAILSGSRLH